MTNEQLKEWCRFYLRLIGTNIWNGFVVWFYTICGAGAAQMVNLADLSSLGIKGAFFSLLGTIFVTVAVALNVNRLPAPTPPTP